MFLHPQKITSINNSDDITSISDDEVIVYSSSPSTTSTTTTTSTNKITNSNDVENKDDKDDKDDDNENNNKKEDEFVVINNNEFIDNGLIMYDSYGFLVDQDQIQKYIIYKDRFLREDNERKNMWVSYFERHPNSLQSLSVPPVIKSHPIVSTFEQQQSRQYRQPTPKVFKEMIRKGIHPEFRSIIWLRCSGAYTRLSENPDEYYNILKQYKDKKSIATKQILMDVDRTFPDHKFLNSPENMERLTNVLTAYSWRNPKVGYCQCMNFIAGFLLIYMSEHEAYWTLVSIIEDLLPSEYFTTTMIDSSVDVRFVFDELLQKKLPKLYHHFQSLNLTLPLIVTQWFLCIMATTTPTETTFRIWDVFFSEGSKVLFRVALTFFKLNEEKLLSCNDYGTLYNLIKKIPNQMYDSDDLLDVCFNKLGSFPMKNILQKRKDSKEVVTSEYIAFQKIRNQASPPKRHSTVIKPIV
eukprot:gene5921-7371_t